MGVYRKLCYAVEDLFVKLLTRGQDPADIHSKVQSYRTNREEELHFKKKQRAEAAAEQKRKAEEQRMEVQRLEAAKREAEEKRRRQLEAQAHSQAVQILKAVANPPGNAYTRYEYVEVRTHSAFFVKVVNQVLESAEAGFAFLGCNYYKSVKIAYRGYLIVTNKRVWFVSADLLFTEKLRYPTISNVVWEAGGLTIGYGKRTIRCTEILDKQQLQHVGSLILRQLARE